MSEDFTREAALAAWEREAARLDGEGGMVAVPDPSIPGPAGKLIKPSEAQMVLRHGGRSVDSWKCRGWGPNQFDKLARAMRQGGVALVEKGQILRFSSAPRLRTRW